VCERFVRRTMSSLGREVTWRVAKLPGPVAVTYEAGPTGFGLARALQDTRARCVVVAPSKLERPPGNRVKTDRRDARRWRGCCTSVRSARSRVPSRVQEDARDLVRAREAARSDLMRARHRLSKLLLRHGIVYYGGQAWTGRHEVWLRQQRFDTPCTAAAFDEAFDAVLTVAARRDRARPRDRGDGGHPCLMRRGGVLVIRRSPARLGQMRPRATSPWTAAVDNPRHSS
jgi:transposase